MRLPILLLVVAACGGNADDLGLASECDTTGDCPVVVDPTGADVQLECLTEFTAGYCAIADCTTSADCPVDSICVAHGNGTNYCFRVCLDKSECNANRSADSEANCSSNFVWAEPSDDDGSKACIPPSSGT